MGTSGLEPPTSRLSGVRSNHLSYAPKLLLRNNPQVFLSSFLSLFCWSQNRKTWTECFWLIAVFTQLVVVLFITMNFGSLIMNRLSPMVEMRRIELLTPCLQSRCSPSWATPPFKGLLCSFQDTWSLRHLQNWTTIRFFPLLTGDFFEAFYCFASP